MQDGRICEKAVENRPDSSDLHKDSESQAQYGLGVHHELPPSGTVVRSEMEKRLIRKLDFRLLPTISFIYIVNYIDRNGITAARLKGLQEDLNLDNVQYATLIAVLYASYCPAQIPSNMILNFFSRPSIYIGACVVLWGLFSAMTGVTTNEAGIIVCRILIGLPEAAFYPGAVYLLSRWYTRKELGLRGAGLVCGLMLANAFGSLIAAGVLSSMEGTLGIRAWRWLFYVEGAATVAIGFLTMWILPDYPHNTRWIKGPERRLAQARLAEDAAEADMDNNEDSLLYGLKLAIKDPLVLMFTAESVLQILGISFINFFPTLTATLGYSTTVTLLLAAPPWLFAALVCLLVGWHADKTGERFFHISICWWFAIVGFIIASCTMNLAARYVSLFLMASAFAGFAMNLTWVSNAIPRPPAKRAAAMGLVNGVGNLGILAGSYIWDASWGPRYHRSFIICIAGLTGSTVLSFVIRQMIIQRNKEMLEDELKSITPENKLRVEEAARIEGITFEEAMVKRRGFKLLY